MERKRTAALGALALAAAVLAATADERVFGLITDGQIMTRTAFSMVELGEIGIAQGHTVSVVRPSGDAVTRYGMGASLVRTLPVALAAPFERAFGVGASQTLFVLSQLLLVLLAAWAAGSLARSFGAGEAGARRAVLGAAVGSPLWAYAASDFSEPLQAAVVGAAFAAAMAARSPEAGRRSLAAAVGAGAFAGLAVLSKSVLVVLLPAVVVVAAWGLPLRAALGRAALVGAGWLPFFGAWLAFEYARFGGPFAGYEGEHFNHPVLDGLWRLTVGPNKGLLVYFPLGLLAAFGLAKLFRRDRAAFAGVAGFCCFVLVSTAAWWSWDGAAGWGPRLLVPILPLLAALAALGAASLPAAVFWVLFGLGAAVNAVGALQPDGPTTWYYMRLEPRVLTEEEAKGYARYATVRGAAGKLRLGPWFDVSNHAGLSQVRVSAWLLAKRLAGGDLRKALETPPWRTDVPGQKLALRSEEAIPESALVFLTSPFRWPHLGMSLTRDPKAADTVLSYVDCLYDQALRGQDTGDGGRAVAFAERLLSSVPGPQSAVAMAEGLRIAGRREAFVAFVKETPRERKALPEFGVVLALFARDGGDEATARRILEMVLRAAPRPEFQALAALPIGEWPRTLREVLRRGRAGRDGAPDRRLAVTASRRRPRMRP